MHMWMQGNRPLLRGTVPVSVQITQWGSPVADALQQMFRQQTIAPKMSGLGVLEQHPYYNDPSYWRMSWGIAATTSMILGAFLGGFHGRRRSGGKMGPTLGYGLAGALLPLPTLAVAGVQGFAKRRGR